MKKEEWPGGSFLFFNLSRFCVIAVTRGADAGLAFEGPTEGIRRSIAGLLGNLTDFQIGLTQK
jgi:hypothetical protein